MSSSPKFIRRKRTTPLPPPRQGRPPLPPSREGRPPLPPRGPPLPPRGPPPSLVRRRKAAPAPPPAPKARKAREKGIQYSRLKKAQLLALAREKAQKEKVDLPAKQTKDSLKAFLGSKKRPRKNPPKPLSDNQIRARAALKAKAQARKGTGQGTAFQRAMRDAGGPAKYTWILYTQSETGRLPWVKLYGNTYKNKSKEEKATFRKNMKNVLLARWNEEVAEGKH